MRLLEIWFTVDLVTFQHSSRHSHQTHASVYFLFHSIPHSFIHSVTDFHPHTNTCGGTVWKDYGGLRKIAGSRCSHHASPHTSWPPVRSSGLAVPLAFQPDNTEQGWPSQTEMLAHHRWAAVSRVMPTKFWECIFVENPKITNLKIRHCMYTCKGNPEQHILTAEW